MDETVTVGLLDYLPLPKEGVSSSAWAVIDIKRLEGELRRAARELGDALLALSFSEYESLAHMPAPPGVECVFLTDGPKQLRVMRQYDLHNSRDLYQLTVIVK